MTRLLENHGGTLATGEVGLPIGKHGNLTLPCGIYARWWR
jgi:hypothetical protein